MTHGDAPVKGPILTSWRLAFNARGSSSSITNCSTSKSQEQMHWHVTTGQDSVHSVHAKCQMFNHIPGNQRSLCNMPSTCLWPTKCQFSNTTKMDLHEWISQQNRNCSLRELMAQPFQFTIHYKMLQMLIFLNLLNFIPGWYTDECPCRPSCWYVSFVKDKNSLPGKKFSLEAIHYIVNTKLLKGTEWGALWGNHTAHKKVVLVNASILASKVRSSYFFFSHHSQACWHYNIGRGLL